MIRGETKFIAPPGSSPRILQTPKILLFIVNNLLNLLTTDIDNSIELSKNWKKMGKKFYLLSPLLSLYRLRSSVSFLLGACLSSYYFNKNTEPVISFPGIDAAINRNSQQLFSLLKMSEANFTHSFSVY